MSTEHTAAGSSQGKHTPGPWTAYIPVSAGWYSGIDGPNREPVCWTGKADTTGFRKIEDAILAASAPELLKALEPFAKFACSPAGECDCHNCRARDAIAKARGGVQ